MEFAKGDKVKVICTMPSRGWGRVKRGDVGVVEYIHSNGMVTANFERHAGWNGMADEFELVEAYRGSVNRDLGRPEREW